MVAGLDPDDELKRTLAILDTAAILGLTDKEAKLHMMSNIIGPFDIVEGTYCTRAQVVLI